MKLRNRAYAYLVTALLIGSLTPVLLAQTGGTSMPEFFLVASVLSIPVGLALVLSRKKTRDVAALAGNGRKLFFLAMAVLLMYVPYEYGIAYAEHFVSASLATVIFRANPLFMLALLPIFLRERLSKRQVLALSLAFVGVLIGLSGGNFSSLLAGNASAPILAFLLLMAFGYAFANVVIKWQMFDTDVLLSLSGIILSVFFGLLFVAGGARFAPLTAADMSIIAYLAVTNIASFYMYFYALKTLKTTMVMNVFAFSSFLTMGYAAALFAEQIKLYYLAIAALVSAGIIIQRSDKIGGSHLSKSFSEKLRDSVIFDVTGAFADNGNVAISSTIKNGGRVLAMRVDGRHRDLIDSLAIDESNRNLFTESHPAVSEESDFVKQTVDARDGDIVVIKVGSIEEGEGFFSDLSEKMVKL